MSVLLFLYVVLTISWSRTLYQSQCVFRHGARAGYLFNIAPYDTLFDSLYKAKPSGLTTEGVKQHKAFGAYLKNKYINLNPYFYTRNYYEDAKYISVSTTNIQRTHQSVQSLLSELYSDEFVPIYTVPESEDVLRVQSACLNFEAEFEFQGEMVINYAHQLFTEADIEELFQLIPDTYFSCNDMALLCYILLADQYNSISFHFDDSSIISDDGARDTLDFYHEKLELLWRYTFFNPHTSDAQNIGFDLLNEIVNHINCSIHSYLNDIECDNANNQLFENECDAGFCGLVLHSAHDTTIRSLAHQLGVLTEDSIFNNPPFASSICFDVYLEDNNIDHTVDVLYGYTVKDESAEFGYNYKQQYIEAVDDINKLSINSNGMMTVCNGDKCKLDDVIKYRNNRIPTNDGCCTINGNSKTYFQDEGCANYELTTDEIAELNDGIDSCSIYRNLCPQTACGIDGKVYAPALQKCVDVQSHRKRYEKKIKYRKKMKYGLREYKEIVVFD